MAVSVGKGAARAGARAACDHADLAYLGAGGDATYHRCRECGAGVVEQRGRRWVLRKRA